MTNFLGNVDPVCPYCGRSLNKMPGRKTKCPRCGECIHVRTRPSDNTKVLVTEAQVEKIDEQWFIFRGGTPEGFLAAKQRIAREKRASAVHFELEKTRLASRFGREPSDNDVRWALLNQNLLDHIQERNWGLFRNVKLIMAELVRSEGRSTEALGLYLEVCYLDLNGPNNIGGNTERELVSEFSPWNPVNALSLGLTALPGLAINMIQKVNATSATVEEIFRERTSALYAGLHLPLSPEDAWPKVRHALFG